MINFKNSKYLKYSDYTNNVIIYPRTILVISLHNYFLMERDRGTFIHGTYIGWYLKMVFLRAKEIESVVDVNKCL